MRHSGEKLQDARLDSYVVRERTVPAKSAPAYDECEPELTAVWSMTGAVESLFCAGGKCGSVEALSTGDRTGVETASVVAARRCVRGAPASWIVNPASCMCIRHKERPTNRRQCWLAPGLRNPRCHASGLTKRGLRGGAMPTPTGTRMMLQQTTHPGSCISEYHRRNESAVWCPCSLKK